MKLLNEYLLMFNKSSIKDKGSWLKLELYLDESQERIFPILYCYDSFRLKRIIGKQSKQWMWFQELGWCFPRNTYILTTDEDVALHIVTEYMECKTQGIPIPLELQEKLKEVL